MKGALASSRSASPPARRPIRLMIVDDSMVARAVLSRMVAADGSFDIAAVAGTAEDAIEALAQVTVDIILLDLEMPGVGGLKALPSILKAARGAKVLIVSSMAEEGAEITVAALRLGATDTLAKPGTGRFNGKFSEVLVGKLMALGHGEPYEPVVIPMPTAPRYTPAPPRPVLAPLKAMGEGPVKLVAIGASTGGIHALATFFENLPGKIGAPIVVTQHLPPPFMTVFARQLAAASGRPAHVATDGMVLQADHIYVAPGEAHLTVRVEKNRYVARLTDHRVSSGCLPSVDPMFESVGLAAGNASVGIVLTGMGRDGTEGAHTLIAHGGSILAQDEASCAVWGMPRAVAEAGLASGIMPPDKIARRLLARIEEAAQCK